MKKAKKYIAFIGDFKKLIPMGFTFQKLYASNYKCYSKGDINSDVLIWVAGRRVEIHDYHSLSYLLVQDIINDMVLWDKEIKRDLSDGYCELYIDLNTLTYINWEEYNKRNKLHRIKKEKGYREQRMFCVDKILVDIVRELLGHKLIELRDK